MKHEVIYSCPPLEFKFRKTLKIFFKINIFI